MDEYIRILTKSVPKIEEVSISDDDSKDEGFNFKRCIEDSPDEDDVYINKRRGRDSESRSPPKPKKKVKREIHREEIPPIIVYKKQDNPVSDTPTKVSPFRSRGNIEENVFNMLNKKYDSNADSRPPLNPGMFGGHGIPPPPPPKKSPPPSPLKPAKISLVAKEISFVILEKVPSKFNNVNQLNKYFSKYGDIESIKTESETETATVHFKQPEFALKAIEDDSSPIELKGMIVKRGSQSKVIKKVVGSLGHRVVSRDPLHGAEAKKRSWKSLKDDKSVILMRQTSLIQLLLEMKQTYTSEKAQDTIKRLINEAKQKMKRVNEFKDVDVLHNEFSAVERDSLDFRLLITSDVLLDYTIFSKLLATFGKVERLVIGKEGTDASVHFVSLISAFRAYQEFKKNTATKPSFKDETLSEIIMEVEES